MGYYSDVRIVMSQEGWKVFKGYVDENCGDEVYNLAEHLDVWYTRDNWVYFGWNSIKFYDDFEEVAAVYQGLDCLKESDYSYNFAEMGEEITDFNTLQYSSKTRKEERWLLEPYVEKHFDDLYPIKGVEMQSDIIANRYFDTDQRMPEVLEKAAQKIREKRAEEERRWEEKRKINEQRTKNNG